MLPDALASFANSPSGWTVLTALLVAAARPSLTLGATLGAGALTGVLIADGIYGLTVVSSDTSPVYWTLCLVAGAALVGATAARLRTPRAAAGVLASAVAATGVLSLGYGVLNGVS